MTTTVSSRSECNVLTYREVMALGLNGAASQALQEAIERYERTNPTGNSREYLEYALDVLRGIHRREKELCGIHLLVLKQIRERLIWVVRRLWNERRIRLLARIATNGPGASRNSTTRSSATTRRQMAPVAAPPLFA
ncbi:hypothetical protein [Achromobacter insuavis]|uniref:hypothetical protein n=1 Tax=Achromobacter insuavis TaxID=1287735 RepID=UPI0013C2CB00|nr:hypothetical protein [Achromobacter insuavis]